MSKLVSTTLQNCWQTACEALVGQGVNLNAVIDCRKLRRYGGFDAVPAHGRLLVFAAGGRNFWRSMKEQFGDPSDPQYAGVSHPVDDFSKSLLNEWVAPCFTNFEYETLYPGNTTILLPRLGEYLGWSFPSPLGLGISQRYGLWFAYRGLCWTDAALVPTATDRDATTPPMHAPCDTCSSRECVTHCPTRAVTGVGTFDLRACANFRLAASSPCQHSCLSRRACPVASDERYSHSQHGYHQGRSLDGIARWLQRLEDDQDDS